MFNKIKLFFIILKETLQRRIYYWKKSKYFIEWDYSSILLAEKAVIERMIKTYDGTEELNDKQLSSLKTALNLLKIVLAETEITESDGTKKLNLAGFPSYGYKLLVKVNTRNAKRFMTKDRYESFIKYKEEPLFLEDYYRDKAFDIYNRFRTQYLYSWWT